MISLSHPLLLLLGSFIVLSSAQTPLGPCDKNSHITYYTYNSYGTCGFQEINGPKLKYSLLTAPNEDLFNSSYSCGVCYQLTGPRGSAIVMVADLCPKEGNPLCSTQNQHFDLGGPDDTSTFARIADPNLGIVSVTAVPVACPIEGNLGVATKDGVNAYWMGIMAYNHKVGVDRMEIQPKAGAAWVTMKRQPYNYFIFSGPGQIVPPYNVRVTSIYGEQITVTLTDVQESKVWPSNSQFTITSSQTFASCSGSSPTAAPPAPTSAPTPTDAPSTSSPSPTSAPVTDAPVTSAPVTSAPVTAAPSSNVMVVYDDAFQNGWFDVSWGIVGGAINYKSTVNTHSGQYCAQFQLSGWAGLQFYNNAKIDWAAKGYYALTFWIRSDVAYTNLEVNIANTGTMYYMSLTTSWQFISVPLGSGGLNAAQYIGVDNKIVMQNQQGSTSTTFYLDDVKIISKPASDQPSFLQGEDLANGANHVVGQPMMLVCVIVGLVMLVLF